MSRPGCVDRRNLTPRSGRSLVFLVGDSAFTAAGLEADARRFGSLTSQVRALLGDASALPSLSLGALEPARRYARNIDEIRFCVEHLIPSLRRISGQPLCEPAEVAGHLDDLKESAAQFSRRLARPIPIPEADTLLSRFLRPPCAVLHEVVVPLEKATKLEQRHLCVAIEGEAYRLRLDSARSLRDVQIAARLAVQHHAQHRLTHDKSLTRLVQKFLFDMRALIARFQVADCRHHVLLHRDPYHQLQHRQGFSVLVAGPARIRIRPGHVYFGLAVRGKTREQRLALPPRPARSPGAFWSPSGEPLTTGPCPGNPQQYARLLRRDLFDEGEAFIQRLDAGTIIGTLRPLLHSQFRANRLPAAAPAAKRRARR